MELIRGLHNLRPPHRPCVASIGNFDGVHLGHRAVLNRLAACAAALGLPATAVVFEPQPDEFFARGVPAPRLTRLREKLVALRALDVARVLCLRFDAQLAAMPAAEFVERLLVTGLGVRHLVIGPDFRFGQGRRGDVAFLAAAGKAAGFGVESVAPLMLGEERVSSTALRQALAAGDLARAERLLGRRYALQGRVGYGEARGRTLGFPTANLPLRRSAPPLTGVYAVEVDGVQPGIRWPGVANLGWRPTVGGSFPLLEVHLLGYSGNLYGRHLEVSFVRHLRAERKFPTLAALKRQIAEDVAAARACLRAA